MRERVAARLPEIPVELAFLELMEPDLDEALRRVVVAGARRVSIIPLFMAQGGHLKQDLPRKLERLRERHPQVHVAVSPAIGDVAEILDAISIWVVAEHRALNP
ncbi:MAG: CbiX/SirB N-terminal domain-containing protein [Betaproteobacteria bacterium]|nr:CbiX/SirB N-terminal domain-containing protein [Betaproteobacteria bacterium]